MELELKHLAPYLPYQLNVKTKIGNLILCQINNSTKWKAWFYFCKSSKNKNQLYNFNNLINADGVGRGFLLKEINPFLKPLSDLIDNILEDGNDENYELYLQLSELLNTNDCTHFVKALIDNKYYAIDVRLWNDIEEWLNKNHFDWKFNLIEKGLAIDINTLNK